MDNTIESRLAAVQEFNAERQLEFANNERIRLALVLAEKEKRIADLEQEVMWLKTNKGIK